MDVCRRASPSGAGGADADGAPPDSREEALAQACAALAAQLGPQAKAGAKKGGKGKGAAAEAAALGGFAPAGKRLLVEIPVAEDGAAAAVGLAQELIAGLPPALRQQFTIVCPDGAAACVHQGSMPGVAALLRHPGAARAFRYVADAPTTTTQRLKAMVSGGPPSFFDLRSTFTAGAMDEDNLVDQLAGSGRRLAFVGDATWTSLFPTQFAPSLPFPCFNIKDLDTVDDGVWAHLIPDFVRRPEDWDVLVAHYLGVDHAGHAHGVRSAAMGAKVRQTDAQVAEAVAEMAPAPPPRPRSSGRCRR
jgi:hypothetical protein